MLQVGASYSFSSAFPININGRVRLVYIKYEYSPNRGLSILEVRERTNIDRLLKRVAFNTKLQQGVVTVPQVAFGLLNLFGPYKDLKIVFDNSTREKILNIYADR